jgi:hypothetical protein
MVRSTELARSMDNLNHFAAPFFSGLTFGAGLSLIAMGNYATASFLVVFAVMYWIRVAQLVYREAR